MNVIIVNIFLFLSIPGGGGNDKMCYIIILEGIL